jgi:DNA-binding SARP family transcriptional activator
MVSTVGLAVSSQDRPRFMVSLLGGFELRCEGSRVAAAPAAQRLVAFVATRAGSVSRAVTAQTLWPGVSDLRAAANLRSTLWRLRHDRGSGPIRCTPNGLDLGPETVVDIHAVHARAAGLSRAFDEEPSAGELEPGVLRHDVLPDWSDEWLLSTREWFRQIRLHALEALCAQHCRAGRFNAALEAGMAAITCEPLRESAHRAVVRVHLAEGNPAEALRQYRIYRRLLNTELGLPPSPQFHTLIAHLQRPHS